MTESKKIAVEILDMHRFLVGNVRYGCSRNNHLMPAGAFEEVKKFIPKMLKIDSATTVLTVKQICEEVIEALALKFWDGVDDDYGNKRQYIEFIKWCLEFVHTNGEVDYLPYNNDQFQHVIDTDFIPQFIVMDNNTQEILVDREHALTRNEYMEYIVKEILHAKDGETCSYNFQHIMDDRGKVMGHVFNFTTPIERSLVVVRLK